MSFGFGVGDFLAAIDIVKKTINACRDGPGEYQEIYRELKSLRVALMLLEDDRLDQDSLLNKKGSARAKELFEIVDSCEKVVEEIQSLIDQHSSLQDDGPNPLRRVWDAYQIGSTDLDTYRGRLTFYTSIISVFLQSLEGTAIARIEKQVNRIYARLLLNDALQANIQARQKTPSLMSTNSVLSLYDSGHEDDAWDLLKMELVAEGITMAHVQANKEDIVTYFKTLIEDGMPTRPELVSQIYGSFASFQTASVPLLPVTNDPRNERATVELHLRQGLALATDQIIVRALRSGEPLVHSRVAKTQYGTWNRDLACLIGLEVFFTPAEGERVIAGHVYLTLKPTSRTKGKPIIGEIFPVARQDAYYARQTRTSAITPLLIAQSATGLPLTKVMKGIGKASARTSWTLTGFRTIENGKNTVAAWNIIRSGGLNDGDHGLFRVALIVHTEGEGFTATVEAKATKRARWQLLNSSGRSELSEVSFPRVSGGSTLSMDDLRSFVKEVDEGPRAQKLIKG